MKPRDSILFRELPVIQKIIDHETWLEGERRGCPVSPDDRVVREKVCEVVLRIGQQLRESLHQFETAGEDESAFDADESSNDTMLSGSSTSQAA